MAGAPPKVDVRRTMPHLYAPRNRDWQPVEVPELRYLAIDGQGDPNTSRAYADAVAALYSVAYPLKMACKRELGRDHVVPPLEGLWHAEDPSVFVAREKSAFRWTMLVLVPDGIESSFVDDVQAAATQKKPSLPVGEVRLQTLAEGPCLQALHVGSYDDEGPLLARLHDRLMPEQGLTFAGHHHEIYLVDPRRAAPEKLRTILRQPVRAV